jgi:hypothetical protein
MSNKIFNIRLHKYLSDWAKANRAKVRALLTLAKESDDKESYDKAIKEASEAQEKARLGRPLNGYESPVFNITLKKDVAEWASNNRKKVKELLASRYDGPPLN